MKITIAALTNHTITRVTNKCLLGLGFGFSRSIETRRKKIISKKEFKEPKLQRLQTFRLELELKTNDPKELEALKISTTITCAANLE